LTGKRPDGSHYDAVMRNIRGNHIALVDTGRAGSECRLVTVSAGQEQQMQLNLQSITLRRGID
jgi:hypothetical protein